MAFVYRRRRPESVLNSLRTELLEAIRLGAGRFAPRDRLGAIWTPEVLEDFAFHEKLRFPLSTAYVHRHFLQNISILVYIGWDGWSRLDEIFLSHRNSKGDLDRTDDRIPDYDLQTLQSDDFLGFMVGEHFFDTRHLFCPIDIVETSDVKRENGWKLPFLEGNSMPCGRGQFARVTKEVIPAGHYLSGGALSKTPTAVACKVLNSKKDYDRETSNLRMLRDSKTRDARIVLPVATVVIGDQFSILFPLAEMNLDDFLAGGLASPKACDTSDILTELMGLAGALAYLHNGLGSNTQGYHADLKPANILVMNSGRGPLHSEIGMWKITDFGLSVIARVAESEGGYGPPEETVADTIIQLQRSPSTYHAPEVCQGLGVNSSSDIWSLGCIMVRVLAFKLDDIAGLQSLDQLRAKDDDGITPFGNDYFHRGTPPKLNPHVDNWIRNLLVRYHTYNDEFLQRCAKLLLRILSINGDDRPEAKEVQQLLGRLKAVHDKSRQAQSVGSRPEAFTATAASNFFSSESGSYPLSLGNSSVSDYRSSEPPLHESTGTVPSDALTSAIREQYQAVVMSLLSQNVDVQKADHNGDTPLGIAAGLGNAHIVRLLLNAGAKVNATSRGGETPLMLATRHNHRNVAQILLQYGADCKVYSEDGWTCLHYVTLSATILIKRP
ncbi:kinase-like domain-containing protein [Aspergillus pseudoustus]|uniref:Kinase-like domain-containing protein n=1 Tax=Aspergillus pseudoustus TaxID=1810923 RepID=A0ABR4JNY2_9EURO